MASFEEFSARYPDSMARVIDGRTLSGHIKKVFDVVVVGSGAGGSIAAWVLARAGFNVAIVEAGDWLDHGEYPTTEADAYAALYQYGGYQATKNQHIHLWQGRTVGGSTTVSWASAYRTPPEILRDWRERLGMGEFSEHEMMRWFGQLELSLQTKPWNAPPNANNAVLKQGSRAWSYEVETVSRHAPHCRQLGRCHYGCPLNARRDALDYILPDAIAAGAWLFMNVRAQRIVRRQQRAEGIHAIAHSHARVALYARHIVVAAGAIQTPALLLRSRFPDPYRRLGWRTMLQPSVLSIALMPEAVHAGTGAPQSVISRRHMSVTPREGPLGYNLEALPLHPMMLAHWLPQHGRVHAAWMRDLPNLSMMMASIRDGFTPKTAGGRVKIHTDGTPELDYVLTPDIYTAIRRAWNDMIDVQFAAGALAVMPVHDHSRFYSSRLEAHAAVAAVSFTECLPHVLSFHPMGGCAMSAEAKDGVVNTQGRHWQIPNVSIIDASILPTSLGVPPQATISALALRQATFLSTELMVKNIETHS